MDWENQPPQQARPPELNDNGCGVNNGGLLGKVMTDEQIEILRKQIAAYATICKQLVDLHKSLASQHDLEGVRLGNLYCHPIVTSGGHKFMGRQRWTPTPVQLQILERIFDQGHGTPSKHNITEITSELSQHGQVSETNIYNWFQNRRARSKRKQQAAPANDAASEMETGIESPNGKKTKPEDFQPLHIPSSRSEDLCFQYCEVSTEIHSLDPQTIKAVPMFSPEGSLNHAGSLGNTSFCGSMSSNPRMEQLIGKTEVPGNYNPNLLPDEYMIG
ncbi:WUSCHEL-related homeobox 13 [Forsythia ovata]|uniref:WUSCHEL-related homeobox 13 n=1 Tax=Forsythia ovata TaxID=205694 RepID=A0ABD1P1C0_9LAMI